MLRQYDNCTNVQIVSRTFDEFPKEYFTNFHLEIGNGDNSLNLAQNERFTIEFLILTIIWLYHFNLI